jgi:hypothetical protein
VQPTIDFKISRLARVRFEFETPDLEGLRKTTKNLSQDSQCPSQNSDMKSSKYKSETLPFQLSCSVESLKIQSNACLSFDITSDFQMFLAFV